MFTSTDKCFQINNTLQHWGYFMTTAVTLKTTITLQVNGTSIPYRYIKQFSINIHYKYPTLCNSQESSLDVGNRHNRYNTEVLRRWWGDTVLCNSWLDGKPLALSRSRSRIIEVSCEEMTPSYPLPHFILDRSFNQYNMHLTAKYKRIAAAVLLKNVIFNLVNFEMNSVTRNWMFV